tara:strand:- start:1504 stop:1845 length:342 start_codon:yes stop_codon:yes gene_type:complete
MANTIIAKRITARDQNSARVTLHIDTSANVDSDFLTFTLETGETKRFQPGRIETVINMGPNDCTVDGKVFESGNWLLSQFGGLPFVGSGGVTGVVPISGTSPNVIIELRGFLI